MTTQSGSHYCEGLNDHEGSLSSLVIYEGCHTCFWQWSLKERMERTHCFIRTWDNMKTIPYYETTILYPLVTLH